MREYILTEAEVKEIETFLKGGSKTANIYNLKSRAKKSHMRLDNDLRLIKKFLMSTGIYVSDEYTPLEVLEERRRDREAQEALA